MELETVKKVEFTRRNAEEEPLKVSPNLERIGPKPRWLAKRVGIHRKRTGRSGYSKRAEERVKIVMPGFQKESLGLSKEGGKGTKVKGKEKEKSEAIGKGERARKCSVVVRGNKVEQKIQEKKKEAMEKKSGKKNIKIFDS